MPVPKKLVKRHHQAARRRRRPKPYLHIREKVTIPPELYDMTLQSLSPLGPNILDKTAMLWRKYTNSVLSSLFHQADIPVVSQHANGQLIPWVVVLWLSYSLYIGV